MTSRQAHWDAVYRNRDPEQVSWYQENPDLSLRLIDGTGLAADSRIIDVGGGASRLADRLIGSGYLDVTVLDLSATALDYARRRLGRQAAKVTWIRGDVTEGGISGSFDCWHDRAVFHFLCEEDDRIRYVEQLREAVGVGGHVIIATFSLDGPEKCSGLPIQRYSEESLERALGSSFEVVGFEEETHVTPTGGSQHFLYGWFRRLPVSPL